MPVHHTPGQGPRSPRGNLVQPVAARPTYFQPNTHPASRFRTRTVRPHLSVYRSHARSGMRAEHERLRRLAVLLQRLPELILSRLPWSPRSTSISRCRRTNGRLVLGGRNFVSSVGGVRPRASRREGYAGASASTSGRSSGV